MKALNRSALVTTLLLALVALPAVAGGGEPLKIGSKMPAHDATFRAVDGTEVSLADVAGEKGTLVIFTCNHCPYVKAWESRTVKIANEAKQMGFGVIALNANDPSKYEGDSFEGMVKRAKATGMRYPYVVDEGSKLAQAFGASRTPEVFLFDAEGELVYHGTIDDDYKDASAVDSHYLRDAVKAVSEGKDVPEETTKALGCSIKWYS